MFHVGMFCANTFCYSASYLIFLQWINNNQEVLHADFTISPKVHFISQDLKSANMTRGCKLC